MLYRKIDKMQVYLTENRHEMGAVAGQDVIALIHTLLQEKETLNIMFAAAPSQDDVLEAIAADPEIDWSRINGFHMDEYIGLPADAPQGFGNFLKDRIFSKKPFKRVHYIDPTTATPEKEAERYEEILRQHPMDICILGVGENGHIAFNDPPADFETHEAYIVVNLDERCKKQQLGEGWFATMADVPNQAISMTVYQIMQSKAILSVVPGLRKAQAIQNTLEAPQVTNRIPATKLREHSDWELFLDSDSASLAKCQ